MTQVRGTCQIAFLTISAAFLCLWLALGMSAPSAAQEDEPNKGNGPALRVMTFNIRVGYGGKHPSLSPWDLRKQAKNLPPIIEAIRSVEPDIIGLQEVYHSGQARQIANALGMEYEYAPHPAGSDWWGLAVLTKQPIQSCNQISIGGNRSIMVCRVSVAGRPITVINVHKDHRITDGSSISAIMRAARGATPPVVLIGDFNISPIDPRYISITSDYADTAVVADTENARTALIEGTFATGERIDYVFVDAQLFLIEDAGVTTEEHWAASDHLGYYAALRFYE